MDIVLLYMSGYQYIVYLKILSKKDVKNVRK